MLEANEGLENIFENAVKEAEKRRHEYKEYKEEEEQEQEEAQEERGKRGKRGKKRCFIINNFTRYCNFRPRFNYWTTSTHNCSNRN